MLAYRHAFHAGNHADVLKHVVLLQLLRHMALKDKGFRVVDVHAGAGRYLLDSPQALKKGEFRQGIGRLIRTKTDRGIVTILDARVLTKTYGRLFIDCLPKRDFERLTKATREQLFRPFSS